MPPLSGLSTELPRGHTVSFETLLEWTSERGAGSLDIFRQTHDWLINMGRQKRIPAEVTMATLSRLSHIEVDWRSSTWAAAPPVLTVIPDAGGHALLAGARTRTLLQHLGSELSAEGVTDLFYDRRSQGDAPDAIFIAMNDESDVEQLASNLGVSYEYSVADRLSRVLPSLNSVLSASRSTPPATGFEVKRFDARALRWRASTSFSAPGLYTFLLPGYSEYRFRTSNLTFAVDRATGIYSELRRDNQNVLRYAKEPRNGTLIVPLDAPLPILQARTAVMCSGLDAYPIFGDRIRRFVNVPSRIAVRIAQSLGQNLSI